MKIKKQMTLSISLFLMLAIAFLMVSLPTSNAHDPPWTVPTHAYVTVSPNPVGVGQTALIVMWVDQNPPTGTGGTGPFWGGYMLDITNPDGSHTSVGPLTTTSNTANGWFNFVPDEAGNYTIVFSWPGDVLEDIGEPIRTAGLPWINDTFLGSTSSPVTLVVTQEATPAWPESPLPTEYWQRPINDANRLWGTLASNWLKGTWLQVDYQRWGTSPDSPHILWSEPLTPAFTGGINDAAWPTIPSNKHDYEDPGWEPIIMNGKIYYNTPNVADSATYGYLCRDLYTGELYWWKNGTDNGLNNPYVNQVYQGIGGAGVYSGQSYVGLTQGWLYDYESVNGHGIVAMLIMVQGSTWYLMDASSGNWIMSLVNVPGGTSETGADGSLLKYSYNSATGNILCWNISQAIPPGSPVGTGQQQFKPSLGATIDAVNDTRWTEWGLAAGRGYLEPEDILPRSGYTMNVTIKAGLPNISNVIRDANRNPIGLFGATIYSDISFSGLGSAYNGPTCRVWYASIDEHVVPASPYPDRTSTQNTNLGFGVTLLYDKNFTVPLAGNYTWSISANSADATSKTFTLYNKHTFQMWGYSLETGEQLWGPTQLVAGPMRYYSTDSNSYDGNILTVGYDGNMNCIDALTGQIKWVYTAQNTWGESPYGDSYPLSIAAVNDGKIFLQSTEHSPTKPLWRGSYLRCVNMTDGTELWKILDYYGFSGTGTSVADGKIVSISTYDNNMYCFGKGPSATAVTASPKVSVFGSSVLVEGMVTDISPGTEKFVNAARYPNGVPAIADENMQAWMEYLYMQQLKPADAKGVEVVLSVLDPNNNYYEIGRTTSDANGHFSSAFTPLVPGKYTIYASFEGSNSYWPSYSETAVNVEEAPQTTQAPTPTPASATELYFVPATIGTIVAIIAIGALIIILLLRKR